uniref:Uncharacterized protein n=1 Tax=Anguilla anguilla TaxID=7936 RepID=A0A0E9WIA7_ANGAN
MEDAKLALSERSGFEDLPNLSLSVLHTYGTAIPHTCELTSCCMHQLPVQSSGPERTRNARCRQQKLFVCSPADTKDMLFTALSVRARVLSTHCGIFDDSRELIFILSCTPAFTSVAFLDPPHERLCK